LFIEAAISGARRRGKNYDLESPALPYSADRAWHAVGQLFSHAEPHRLQGPDQQVAMKLSATKITYIVLLALMLTGIYFAIKNSPLADLFINTDLLLDNIRELGTLGPLLVVGLMALAIVFNPLPSAPVALAAGAAYGHTMGTIYIVAGAEIGAICAFLIARTVGAGIIKKMLRGSFSLGRFSSQNALMMAVFVSRLVPFMSFDLVSYAAGLTALNLWRFALATLLGLVPISFALAHMGSEIVDSSGSKLTVVILLAGLLMVIPIIIGTVYRSRQGTDANESEKTP
jgi:uncharacterized membrane protein YdjX (TVP38/TMEM64 family)